VLRKRALLTHHGGLLHYVLRQLAAKKAAWRRSGRKPGPPKHSGRSPAARSSASQARPAHPPWRSVALRTASIGREEGGL